MAAQMLGQRVAVFEWLIKGNKPGSRVYSIECLADARGLSMDDFLQQHVVLGAMQKPYVNSEGKICNAYRYL
eukprot:2481-Eustigmatos_ZCMA.PRE.1